jgi:serine/threonine protein kinase
MLIKKIGEGMYGKVYQGCLNKMCRYKYAAKKSTDNLSLEYRIGLLAYRVAPNGVVRPFKLSGGVLYTQYVSLSKINIKNFTKVFKRVLMTLIKIQKKYPSFRHNDLSWKNVFVDENGNAFIGDFGLSNAQLAGYKNPLIQSGEFKKNYGTYPGNDPRFDIHFFLNSLYIDGSTAMKTLIEQYLPAEYMGVSGARLSNGRLKAGVLHSGLPTMKQLFSMVTTNEQKR